jgi:signal transduction histidine kinase
MVLEMPTPAILFWGPEQLQIYNAGYAVIMGPRHPRYFAAPYRECWPDTYPTINPWMQDVLERGEVKNVERALFPVTRHGFTEDAYFTFTFSPLRDDTGAIVGVFQPVVEVTDIVLQERRAETLRLTAPRPGAAPDDAAIVGAPLGPDVPFALLYLRGEPTGRAVLAAGAGLDADPAATWPAIDDIVERVLRTRATRSIEEAGAPAALALPLAGENPASPIGVLVLGISPRLRFGDPYRAFLEALAHNVAGTLAESRARRLERELLIREQAARREAELQKEHLVSLFTQAPAAIVVLRGREMVVELANPPAIRLWRRDHADVIGKPLFEALPELRGQVFEDLLDRVYRTGETHVGEAVPVRLSSASGGPLTESYLSFVYAPLRDLAGSPDGVLVFAFDVTDQVRANAAKDQFLAILGHELRNPLAPIVTAIQLLRSRDGDDAAHHLDVIERQAIHMIRLVDDLLDLSRITRGKIELAKQRIEIAEVVDDALAMMKPLIQQREHEVVVEIARHGHAVDVDRGRLAQAVSNLVANAAKYTEKRGRITIATERRDGRVGIRVRDTGIGIEAEMLPRVFGMFVLAAQAIDRSQGGLGVGLAIVHSLVELHGGTVVARSDGRHRGSEFEIWLPQAADEPAAATAPPGEAPPGVHAQLPGRRVLVVDDNEDAAELLGELLDAMGCTTRVAHDGPSAVRIATQFEPDVGLLDLGLPIMDGYELAARLRGNRPEMRLIAVTGYGQASDRLRSQNAGFDAHLVKPVNIEALRTLIAQLTA